MGRQLTILTTTSDRRSLEGMLRDAGVLFAHYERQLKPIVKLGYPTDASDAHVRSFALVAQGSQGDIVFRRIQQSHYIVDILESPVIEYDSRRGPLPSVRATRFYVTTEMIRKDPAFAAWSTRVFNIVKRFAQRERCEFMYVGPEAVRRLRRRTQDIAARPIIGK